MMECRLRADRRDAFALQNRDHVAVLRKFIGTSHSARAAPNNGHAASICQSDCRVERLMSECVFVDELFNCPDCYRLRARIENACAFAQAVLWAYAAANLGHVAGGTRQRGSFEEAPFGGKSEPLGNSILERAAVFHALRVWAIDAATGLRARGRFVEQ